MLGAKSLYIQAKLIDRGNLLRIVDQPLNRVKEGMGLV